MQCVHLSHFYQYLYVDSRRNRRGVGEGKESIEEEEKGG